MTTTDDSVFTDRELMTHGFQVLVDTLGNVNAERFITLTIREPEDYTMWGGSSVAVGGGRNKLRPSRHVVAALPSHQCRAGQIWYTIA